MQPAIKLSIHALNTDTVSHYIQARAIWSPLVVFHKYQIIKFTILVVLSDHKHTSASNKIVKG